MNRFIWILLALLTLTSCSNDGRRFKKFLSRVNAREINASSKYIYPGDHAKLHIYADVLEKNPNLFLKLRKKRNFKNRNGDKGIIVELECVNPSPYYRNYMNKLHLMQPSGRIIDTLYIRKTNDGKFLSFNWANIDGENLQLVDVQTTANIRTGMGQDFEIVGQVYEGQHVVIDDYSEDPEWVKCFTIDAQCNTVEGYIHRSLFQPSESVFFPLGIFDSMSILVAFIVIVALGGAFFALKSIAAALWGGGIGGIITLIALILGLIYITYQVIEKILFELFIINLPY